MECITSVLLVERQESSPGKKGVLEETKKVMSCLTRTSRTLLKLAKPAPYTAAAQDAS